MKPLGALHKDGFIHTNLVFFPTDTGALHIKRRLHKVPKGLIHKDALFLVIFPTDMGRGWVGGNQVREINARGGG